MIEAYTQHFGEPQAELKHIFSPYRVCPIGAHVDHQHGLVTGFAIDQGMEEISFIENLPFNSFNEETRLPHCIKMHKRMF